jgi:hypothetical protein
VAIYASLMTFMNCLYSRWAAFFFVSYRPGTAIEIVTVAEANVLRVEPVSSISYIT